MSLFTKTESVDPSKHPVLSPLPSDTTVSIYNATPLDGDFEKSMVSLGHTFLYVDGESFDWSKTMKNKSKYYAFPRKYQDCVNPPSAKPIFSSTINFKKDPFLST